jgi:hypothetical protein
LSWFNSLIDCELSTIMGKGVLVVSNVFREIIGLINNTKIANKETKRKKAKNKCSFDL